MGPYIFNNQRVSYLEYGAGAEIIAENGTIIASFPNHLDAEAFIALLPKVSNTEGCYTNSAGVDTASLFSNKFRALTEHDWLQIEQAAAGCIAGTSDDWPLLRHAIALITGRPFVHRKCASWLQGFCEGVLVQSGRSR